MRIKNGKLSFYLYSKKELFSLYHGFLDIPNANITKKSIELMDDEMKKDFKIFKANPSAYTY